MLNSVVFYVSNPLIKNIKNILQIGLVSRYWNHQDRRTLTALQE